MRVPTNDKWLKRHGFTNGLWRLQERSQAVRQAMTRQTEKKYWLSDVPPQDDFQRPITNEFIDGKTRMGPWAFMTPSSYRLKGVGLGLGRGQRYQKQANGRWLKVEG